MKKKIGAALLVIIMALALGLPVLPASAAQPIYVDANATGKNNGTSWDDAYTDLQSALASDTSGEEIWVAEGTYKPTSGSDRSVSFELDSGEKVYGGFDGTETSREQRDWVANETILSGDIGTEGDSSDNSYHVVMVQSANNIILDGFTITGGNANYVYNTTDRNGGGIWNYYGELTVNNCIIYSNTASFRGGGLFNSGGTVTLNWITISQNTCTGTAGSWATGGGGIEVSGIAATYTTVNLINCIVNGNTATAEGYDSKNYRWREGHGGGIRVGGPNTAVNITNSTIVNNEARDNGGGIRAAGTSTIKNSILWGNVAPVGAQFSGYPTISYSLVQGGYAGTGNISDDPKFWHAYDNLHLQDTSPAIDAGNNSDVPGYVDVDMDGNPRIHNGTVDMGAFEYPNAIQADFQELSEQVGGLVDSEVLNPGQGNALTVKLELALHKMYRNSKTAINQLGAFINQVEDFIDEEILSKEQGQDLIEVANDIISALSL